MLWVVNVPKYMYQLLFFLFLFLPPLFPSFPPSFLPFSFFPPLAKRVFPSPGSTWNTDVQLPAPFLANRNACRFISCQWPKSAGPFPTNGELAVLISGQWQTFFGCPFFVLGYVNRGATYLEMKSTRLFKVSNHGLFTLSPCDMRQYLQKDVAYLWRFSNIWRLYYANGMKWMVHDASWLLGIVTLALLTDIAWINCLKVFKYVCI